MKITLPLPPNRANSRWHWRTERTEKLLYYSKCLILYPKLAEHTFTRATIKVTLYTWSPMDTDNLMARLKWPVDWLVASEYIYDDSPDVLDWSLPRQAIDRKRPRVEIELVEIIPDEAA